MHKRREADRRRPAPHAVGAVGGSLARPRRRHGHPARERGRARDHRRRASRTGVRRAGDDRLRGVPRVGRAVDARGGRARDGRPGRRDPRARARVRARATDAQLCWTLGITEHHNAVDNVFALINLALLDRPRRHATAPACSRCAARTTCRAAVTWARCRTGCPASRTSRTTPFARSSTPPGASTVPPQHGLHLTEMFEAMEHGELTRGLRDRREPGAGRGRPDARRAPPRGPRPPRRAGPLPDADGRARRRRPPRRRDARRGGGHRHLERAPRAARAQGARPAGRGARRHRDRLRARRAASATTSAAPRAEDVWNELRSLSPDARGHELRAARGARRHPVAVPRRERPGRALPPRPAVGRRRRGPRAVPGRRALTAGRPARRRLPAAAHDRAPARVVQHRRAERAATSRRSTSAARRSCSHPRTASATASPTARARASSRAAARSRRPCATTRRCGRASRS